MEVLHLPLDEAVAGRRRARSATPRPSIGLLLVDRATAGEVRSTDDRAPARRRGVPDVDGRRARPITEHARRLPARPRRLLRVARRASDVDDRSVAGPDVERYATARRAIRGERPRRVARQLAAIRMLHRFLVEEGVRADDPTADLDGVTRAGRASRSRSREDEVDASARGSVGDDPVARRDRAILELLYATGMRVSELCGLSLGDLDLDDRSGARVRQGGEGADRALRRRRAGAPSTTGSAPYGRPCSCPRVGPPRRRRGAVPRPARGAMSRQHAWAILRHYGDADGLGRSAVAPRAAPLVRHPPARPRRRPPDRAGAARPRLDLDDPGVHQGLPGAAAEVYRTAHPRARRAVDDAAHSGRRGPRADGPPVSASREALHLGDHRPPTMPPRTAGGSSRRCSPGELALFDRMSRADQEHHLRVVARRFVVAAAPDELREGRGRAAARLGKMVCGLGTLGRVCATLWPFGRNGDGAASAATSATKAIGARCSPREAGSTPLTVALVGEWPDAPPDVAGRSTRRRHLTDVSTSSIRRYQAGLASSSRPHFQRRAGVVQSRMPSRDPARV